jgi:hypothetical protein
MYKDMLMSVSIPKARVRIDVIPVLDHHRDNDLSKMFCELVGRIDADLQEQGIKPEWEYPTPMDTPRALYAQAFVTVPEDYITPIRAVIVTDTAASKISEGYKACPSCTSDYYFKVTLK